MGTKVAVVILNYLHHHDTISCLSSLFKSDLPSSSQVICVDNSPNGDSLIAIKKAYPGIQLIKSDKNLGFAGGNNLGIKSALKLGADYILIINPDVTVGRSFFGPLLSVFSKSPKVGLVAPAIRHYQNDQLFFGLEGYVDWRFAAAKHINLRQLSSKKLRASQFVTFACVLIKSEIFQKVGFLDEGYFMYLEDVDYCLAAGKAGYKIYLNPKVVVRHRTSSSFKRATDKLSVSFKSQVRFISKWLTFPRNIIPLFYTILFYPYLYFLWTYFDFKKRLLAVK
jgi:GT2 family glycosyltransferase